MSRRFSNVGILAHVDAGKTTLTERLLYEAGVIERFGSVDGGDTQTDTMDVERQRGITVRAAVAAMPLGNLVVDIIDTPGHSDFVAEVERSLRVLDAAVVVVSAVEGVQARTRVLLSILRRLSIPTIVFVNKIDRRGADPWKVYATLAPLVPGAVTLNVPEGAGDALASARPASEADRLERLADVLTRSSTELLTDYFEHPERVTSERLVDEFARQFARAEVSPVLFGSALTGVGVHDLRETMSQVLPVSSGRPEDPVRGRVFKVDRVEGRGRVAYVRLDAGSVSARDEVAWHRRRGNGPPVRITGKVRGVQVFLHGAVPTPEVASPGSVAVLSGLEDIQVGDQLGEGLSDEGPLFAPPNLETRLRIDDPAGRRAVFAELVELAELDPLVGVTREDDGTIRMRLYGEVQKQVIGSLLLAATGVEVDFEAPTPAYVERPIGVGSALEEISRDETTYFWATVGLQVEPGPPRSGISFHLDVELGSLPLAFHRAIEETVTTELQEGPHGWPVIDCRVTLTRTGYASPISAAGDFRKATPLTLAAALSQARTEVCEPLEDFDIELPVATVAAVSAAIGQAGGVVAGQRAGVPDRLHLTGTVSTAQLIGLQKELPGLTRGEGVLTTTFHGYRPLRGKAPTRPHRQPDPYDRSAYMLYTLKHQ
ncbi:MAG TPA: GTP-binding protein [Microthrixaceae bacterium]|nr:GTP-binding protein [Microthrixaceae bacterium]